MVGLKKQTNKQTKNNTYWGFTTRMVYLYYISGLRYTILVGNPRYAKISPKMVNPRDVAGEGRREEEDCTDVYFSLPSAQSHFAGPICECHVLTIINLIQRSLLNLKWIKTQMCNTHMHQKPKCFTLTERLRHCQYFINKLYVCSCDTLLQTEVSLTQASSRTEWVWILCLSWAYTGTTADSFGGNVSSTALWIFIHSAQDSTSVQFRAEAKS